MSFRELEEELRVWPIGGRWWNLSSSLEEEGEEGMEREAVIIVVGRASEVPSVWGGCWVDAELSLEGLSSERWVAPAESSWSGTSSMVLRESSDVAMA